MIAAPCGVVIGYGMCAVMLSNVGWEYTFYAQSALLVPCVLLMLLLPSRYMDVNGTAKKQKKHLIQVENDFNLKTKG